MTPRTVGYILLTLNFGLLAAKAIIGVLYGSLAVLSDAANSFTDIITGIVILIALREAAKPADTGHPFGHSRAEPLAAFTVALLTCVLALEVGREAATRLLTGSTPLAATVPLLIMLALVIGVKILMYILAATSHRRQRSPALQAAMVDSRMDIVISLLAVAGVLGSGYLAAWYDALAALAIALYIGWVGLRLGHEHLASLTGGCPSTATMHALHERLRLLKKQHRIRNFHELRAHHVGTEVHVAVHIDIAGDTSLATAHDLDEEIQEYLKGVPSVTQVAVHLDPI
jgi:cation diffusion facilitator family transporter